MALTALGAMGKCNHFPVHFLPRDAVSFLYKVDELEHVKIWVQHVLGSVLAILVDRVGRGLEAVDMLGGVKRE